MDAEADSKQEGMKESKKRQAQVDASVQCLFSRKVCKRKRLKGFDFCHKHIFEDKNSPFQQCSFIIKSTEERCINPAPKAENKKTFCLIHTRDPKLKKAHDEIMRRNMKRKLAQRKATADAKKLSSETYSPGSSQRSPHESKRSRDEDYDQFSAFDKPESDGIYALQDNGGERYDAAWFGENDSDAESVDSEEEDSLRHAGVWTLEEALKMCRDKMIRKRSLYIEQYKRLHVLLKERRRCHLVRMARASRQSESMETDGDIKGRSMKQSERRALGLYQHLSGTELLLEKQAKEKRARGSGTPKPDQQTRCSFVEDANRCPASVLPFSKFCLHHQIPDRELSCVEYHVARGLIEENAIALDVQGNICKDADQRLYKKCSFELDNGQLCCAVPVLKAFRSVTCALHAVPLPRFHSEALQNAINPVAKIANESVGVSSENELATDATKLSNEQRRENSSSESETQQSKVDQKDEAGKKQEADVPDSSVGKTGIDSKEPGIEDKKDEGAICDSNSSGNATNSSPSSAKDADCGSTATVGSKSAAEAKEDNSTIEPLVNSDGGARDGTGNEIPILPNHNTPAESKKSLDKHVSPGVKYEGNGNDFPPATLPTDAGVNAEKAPGKMQVDNLLEAKSNPENVAKESSEADSKPEKDFQSPLDKETNPVSQKTSEIERNQEQEGGARKDFTKESKSSCDEATSRSGNSEKDKQPSDSMLARGL